MKHSHAQGEKGFTLIELMVVVAIIGILAAIAVPQFSKFRDKALDADAISNLKQLVTYQTQFKSDHLIYAPVSVVDKSGAVISTIVNGYNFVVPGLSENVELVCKTSADKKNVIIAAKHVSSHTIFAIDLSESGEIRKLENQELLTGAIPSSTSGADLTSWKSF